MRTEENIIGKASIEVAVEKGFQECYHSHKGPSDDNTRRKPEKLTNEESLEKLFAKLDLSGLVSWSEQDQSDGTSLIKEYCHLFAPDDLELGKRDLVKHSIKLKDYIPFKDRYQRILPHQY